MGSLATAYCLSSIRAAAILNMAIGLFPIAILMLLSGHLMDMVAATCILVAAVFLLQMIFDQQKQWISLLTLQHDIQVLADTDPLTGLLNRRALTQRVEQQMEGEAPTAFLLALLDLDGFKPVNDRHGHGVGDALLCAVAERLVSIAGHGAHVARMGGDEFAILLPSQNDGNADSFITRVLGEFVRPFAVEGHQIKIGASAGVAQWPDDGPTIKALLESADQKLYAVKNETRRQSGHAHRRAA